MPLNPRIGDWSAQRVWVIGASTGIGAALAPQRDQMVRDYNENKIKALLLSRAGGEGLDLKGTRLIQLLEPHWNEEALKQVTGRGIRYRSHSHLPEDQRKVHVQHFVTENNFIQGPGQCGGACGASTAWPMS